MPVLAPQMRSKLAESAFKLFARKGIRAVNLDEVAAQAGVTKGSLYWHYKSKKDVILAACDYYYQRWHAKARAEMAQSDRPLEQLERVLRFSLQSCLFDRENRVFTTEVFAMSLQDVEIRNGWAEFYDSVRSLFVHFVEKACAEGALQVSDPRRAVDWMLATIEGIKQRAAFEPEICTPDERNALLKGLLRIVSEVEAPQRAASASDRQSSY